MNLEEIKEAVEQQLRQELDRCGLMYRLFGRVKTVRSLRHKMQIKGDQYHAGHKIQDVIGLRIVLYFPEDVELLGFYFSCKDLVKSSVDVPGVDTFRPQRLNLTKHLPAQLTADFRKNLPAEFADYIDNTYEVQIRTIFSEGWHEVEHDLRYKCQSDWQGYDASSRTLNGISATLETAEWSMSSLFRQMSFTNLERGEYRSMLRNKLRIRLYDDDFSPAVRQFLASNPDVARELCLSDRMVLMVTLLSHHGAFPLSYDNILFLVNRYEIQNAALQALESPETTQQLNAFLQS